MKRCSERLLCVIVFLGFLLGCNRLPSPPTPSIPSRTLENTNDFPWQESWRTTRYYDTHYENARNLIATKEGVVFTDTPWLRFVEANSSDLRWEVSLDGNINSIAADETRVYVCDSGQPIAAYSLQNGTPVWRSSFVLPGHTGYYLRLENAKLYAYESIDLVYVFNPETGEFLEKLQVPNIGQRPSVLKIFEDGSSLQSNNRQLMLVKDEEITWETNINGFSQKPPEIYEDILVVRFGESEVSAINGLAGLNINSGELIWHRPREFYSNFVLDNGSIYVISNKGEILLLNPQNGQTLGSIGLLPSLVDTSQPISAIAAKENMLYVFFFDSQELIAFKRNVQSSQ